MVNTPVPQATQQPQQENNFIVFGATNTPALQLDGDAEHRDTPTPGAAAAGRDDIQDAAQGDRGKSVISMQEALIKLGYLKARATATSARAPRRRWKNFQKENGLDVDGIAGAKTLEKLYTFPT